MGRFDSKVALITGAASGIGRAVTLRLADEGATVFATDIDGFRLQETVELGGRAVTGHQADVTDPTAVRQLVAACAGALGRLDFAVRPGHRRLNHRHRQAESIKGGKVGHPCRQPLETGGHGRLTGSA